ncbi:galactoside alpha-(1,2)-fucosyltransferase 1-like [Rhynchocyon petersi]
MAFVPQGKKDHVKDQFSELRWLSALVPVGDREADTCVGEGDGPGHLDPTSRGRPALRGFGRMRAPGSQLSDPGGAFCVLAASGRGGFEKRPGDLKFGVPERVGCGPGLRTLHPDPCLCKQLSMWPLGNQRQLCLGFLAACALLAISFLHVHRDLITSPFDLAALCPQRLPRMAPVTINCHSGTLVLANTTRPCPQRLSSLSGTWTFHPNGRLGNQMGQYATLLALSQLNGRRAYIMPSMHATLAPVFRITLPVLAPDTHERTPWHMLELHDWMSEEYIHLDEAHLKLSGFPCSWTFFHHMSEQIRSEFTLHAHLREEAQGLLRPLRLGNTGTRPRTFVGVHVRRGDYVQIMPDRWKGVVGDRAYLKQAMDWFRQRHETPIFVVVSNGMDWCRENIDASQGDVVFAGQGLEASPSRDFALLTQCNHTVMTIGTFGFWAAYLAGGDTVYLANFTLPDSSFLKIFKPEAAFLPQWVGIAADLSPLH